jgi:inorganic pyrophosphatase
MGSNADAFPGIVEVVVEIPVAVGDAHQQHVERLEQVRPQRLVEIEHFFETYKLLEDKTVDVLGRRDHDRARKLPEADRETWKRAAGSAPG